MTNAEGYYRCGWRIEKPISTHLAPVRTDGVAVISSEIKCWIGRECTAGHTPSLSCTSCICYAAGHACGAESKSSVRSRITCATRGLDQAYIYIAITEYFGMVVPWAVVFVDAKPMTGRLVFGNILCYVLSPGWRGTNPGEGGGAGCDATP
jgi:hypothetical protein